MKTNRNIYMQCFIFLTGDDEIPQFKLFIVLLYIIFLFIGIVLIIFDLKIKGLNK